jgi:hypothetical protein
MQVAVHLDGEFRLRAVEVQHILPDKVLATDLEFTLTSAKPAPEFRFRRGEASSKGASPPQGRGPPAPGRTLSHGSPP